MFAGLQSKRPQVKTSPSQNVPKNWSKRPHGIKCWSKRPQNNFLLYILCIFRHVLGCLNETVLDKVFLSRFHSVISVKKLFSNNPSILLYTILKTLQYSIY